MGKFSLFFCSLGILISSAAMADTPIVRTPQGKFPAPELGVIKLECDAVRSDGQRTRVLLRSNPLELFQIEKENIVAIFHGGKIARNATCKGKIVKTDISKNLSLACREKIGKNTTDTSLGIELARGGGKISYSKKGQFNFAYTWTLSNCEQ